MTRDQSWWGRTGPRGLPPAPSTGLPLVPACSPGTGLLGMWQRLVLVR